MAGRFKTVRVPVGAYAPNYSPGSKRRAREEARRNIVPLTPEEVEAKSLANQKWAEEQIAKIQGRYAKPAKSEGSDDASGS